ncbi:MAG: hypothetical protein IT355_06925 [Gemmatimonadaceae bacterium]|nr:hypothetical protein [Gemmatimonadaceae bacterium]
MLLLAAVHALAAWRLIAPEWRPRLRIAAVGLGLCLAVAQWALRGSSWQDLIAYSSSTRSCVRAAGSTRRRWAVIGHSFGGAAAAMALSEDPRVVAAANIDGTPYGDLPSRQLTRPFLLLQSDLTESPHGDLFHTGNGRLLANMTAAGFRYEIRHANHFSFTDAPFFVAPAGRWRPARVMGGSRGGAAPAPPSDRR